MEVSKKILSIMRIIEAIPGYDRSKKMGYIANANKLMDDDDRAVMTDIMKAMILLTAGNQKAVRNPESYDPDGARDNYSWLMGKGVGDIIKKLGLAIDLKSKPTREDYVIAHKLLPILGASNVSPEELGQYTDAGTRDHMDRYGSEGKEKVYRGVAVSRNVILKATTRKAWNIGHGVSTSSNEKKGMEFAKTAPGMWGAKGGPGLLLIIENKSKRGFHAGSMSRYPREHEVILSGMLEFGEWDMELKCRGPQYEDELDLIFHSVSETVVFTRFVTGQMVAMNKRVEVAKQKFPTEDGTTFQEFVNQAVGKLSWSLPKIPGTYKVDESSILLRMNAVLQ